jgi:hypothetical protein
MAMPSARIRSGRPLSDKQRAHLARLNDPANRPKVPRGPDGKMVKDPNAKVHKRPPRTGHTNNPTGVAKTTWDVVQLCREATPAAVEALLEIMQSSRAAAAARVAAANSILDRAWGRPVQALELTGKDGGPLELTAARDRLREKVLLLVPQQQPPVDVTPPAPAEPERADG